jgi:hypothetical protein
MTPPFRELDVVVLVRDVPEAGLRAGDVGAVVHVHSSHAFDVEFTTAGGRTQAVLLLSAADVRPAGQNDLLSVRTAVPN